MCNCSQPNYYYNKGVYYYDKPVNEIDSYLPLKNIDNLTMGSRNPSLIDSMLFLPVVVQGNRSTNIKTYSIVYAIDPIRNSVTDSLVIKNNKYGLQIFCVLKDTNYYFVGLKQGDESNSIAIITTNKDMSSSSEYSINLDAKSFIDATIFNKFLYILTSNRANQLTLSKISLEEKQVLDSKIILPSILASRFFDQSLYLIRRLNDRISIVQVNLEHPDTTILNKEIPINIVSDLPDSLRMYRIEVAKNNLILTYQKNRNISQYQAQFAVVSINLSNESYFTSVQEGLTWKICSIGDKVYVFKSIFKQSYKKSKSYLVLSLVECGLDMKNEREILCFFPSVWNYVQSILPLSNGMVALTGQYQYTLGNKGDVRYSAFIANFDIPHINE